jgi:hypothetical protein
MNPVLAFLFVFERMPMPEYFGFELIVLVVIVLFVALAAMNRRK